MVEKYEGPTITRGFRATKEYEMLLQALKKLRPKEGFIIKEEWKNYPQRLIKELELPFVVRVMAVTGNDKVKRVVRMQ